MKQLSSLDAQFLALENARQNGHVAGVAIHDPSTAPGGEFPETCNEAHSTAMSKPCRRERTGASDLGA